MYIMANEAIIRELHGNPKGGVTRFDVGNSDAIEKGAILFLTDPKTISGAQLNFQPCAGIAAEEKVASDGALSIGVYQKGIFDCVCSEAVTAGALVSLSGANTLRKATSADILSGAVLGKALETASANEVIQVRVNL